MNKLERVRALCYWRELQRDSEGRRQVSIKWASSCEDSLAHLDATCAHFHWSQSFCQQSHSEAFWPLKSLLASLYVAPVLLSAQLWLLPCARTLSWTLVFSFLLLGLPWQSLANYLADDCWSQSSSAPEHKFFASEEGKKNAKTKKNPTKPTTLRDWQEQNLLFLSSRCSNKTLLSVTC